MAKRVLVVDDHVPTRALIRTILEAEKTEQFEVFEAGTGTECLKSADKEGPFDLILLDVNLPDINGLEIIKYVRGSPQYVNTPLIIISTEGHERDRERGLALGASEYLVKPFAPEALVAAVRRLLGA